MYQDNNPIPNHVLWPGWVDPHATLMAEPTNMQLCPYQPSEKDMDKKGKRFPPDAIAFIASNGIGVPRYIGLALAAAAANPYASLTSPLICPPYPRLAPLDLPDFLLRDHHHHLRLPADQTTESWDMVVIGPISSGFCYAMGWLERIEGPDAIRSFFRKRMGHRYFSWSKWVEAPILDGRATYEIEAAVPDMRYIVLLCGNRETAVAAERIFRYTDLTRRKKRLVTSFKVEWEGFQDWWEPRESDPATGLPLPPDREKESELRDVVYPRIERTEPEERVFCWPMRLGKPGGPYWQSI
ncbi:hypothetical protein SMACR_08968 [Sordaria macrospora]|uniref:WGS project CABT00000000 data, contig 2.82 n=2 Tax=Sordaria macrospora TaxID=5147 RepID=F7WBQ2_SORMK|nr:uncharacterized protein SMAC_08968 [Sordaria macrospora k-hell]KAA8624233.1 hypothetical protein SMACR_08968 [Sordaria macrospora]CCC05467.1 unnamed protein product [Sordaria macrospora k-hell]